jgi:predicted Na+-dependent transporter
MNTPVLHLLKSLKQKLSTSETSLTRKENVFTFLVIRFILMSGLVVGFAWTFLQLNP